MIPTSYLVKNLYQDRWGDPQNPHAVDVPVVVHLPPKGGIPVFDMVRQTVTTLRHRFARGQFVTTGQEQPCT